MHPGDEVVHPDGVQRVLGGQQVRLGVEHLVGQGGGAAGVGLVAARAAGRRGEQDRLGVVHLGVARVRSAAAGAGTVPRSSAVPGCRPGRRWRCCPRTPSGPPLPLVADQGGPVSVPLGPADERRVRPLIVSVWLVRSAEKLVRFGAVGWGARIEIIRDVEHPLQGICLTVICRQASTTCPRAFIRSNRFDRAV